MTHFVTLCRVVSCLDVTVFVAVAVHCFILAHEQCKGEEEGTTTAIVVAIVSLR